MWLWAVTAGLAAPVAQTIPFSNGFEYAAGTLVSGITGWDASASSVLVETDTVWDGVAAVVVPASTVVSNAIVNTAMTNVWTECYLRMEPHAEVGAASVNSNAVIDINLDTSGYLQAYAGSNGWLTLSNTVWGQAVPAVTNGQWVRVTVCQDYVTHQCAVFLNGQLVTELLPFVNTNVNACSSFRLEGGSSASSYLDDFAIGRPYPATLTNDWNGAGLTDAQEIDTYGYLAFTLNVGTGLTYTTIQSAVDAALPRYTVNVMAGTYAENVFIAQSLAGLTGGPFAVNGSLGIGPGAVVNVSGLTSCGNLGISNAATLYLAGALSTSNVTVGAGGVLTGTAFTVNGTLSLDMGAVMRASSVTCSGDLGLSNTASLIVAGAVSASNVTIGAGALLTAGAFTVNGAFSMDTSAVVQANSLTCSGNLSVSNAANLTVAGALSAGTMNVTIGVGAVVRAGGLTCSNLSVSSTGSLTVVGAVAATHLTIGQGGTVVITNGSLQADGLVLTGSFTLDSRWNNQQARSTLTFQDNFDSYQAGTPLALLGYRGWGVSDGSMIVESSRAYSGANAVDVGYRMALSNRVDSTGAVQVWTDLRGILSYNANDGVSDVRSNAAFMLVVTTNGYLSVYNRTNGAWDVCTSDVWQNPVLPLTNGQWSRISVDNNFGTKQCAVFLNGVLLRQRLPFINTNLASYSVVTVDNLETNSACVDDMYISAAYPASLTNDVNNNGAPDAQEISVTGDVFTRGSVFKFR